MSKLTIFTKDDQFFDLYNDVLDIVLLPDDAVVAELPETIDEDIAPTPKAQNKKTNGPVETATRKKRKPTQCSTCQGFGHTAKTCGRQTSEGDTPPANSLSALPIDEHEHTYIIDLKNQNKPAMVIAARLSLPIREVNRALQFTTYAEYLADHESQK